MKNLPMQGCTCWKQALVRSPRRANDDCRTSGIGSCIHWYNKCMIFESTTSFSIWPFSPSASPDRRSRATIIKSLSGASNCSGLWVLAWKITTMLHDNKMLTTVRALMTATEECLQCAGLMSAPQGWHNAYKLAHNMGENLTAMQLPHWKGTDSTKSLVNNTTLNKENTVSKWQQPYF